MYTKTELEIEEKSGSVEKFIQMLKSNNEELNEKLDHAIGYLELMDPYMPKNKKFNWEKHLED